MSHIEKAKAAINDRLAAAYRHRGDLVMYHHECKEVLAIVVRTLADENLRRTNHSLRLLVELAGKTIDALEKLDNDEQARLD